jgi:hypothetical protein
MRRCQRILIDEPAKQIKDIYREDLGDEIAAQEVIKRGVGNRIIPAFRAWVWSCGEGPRASQCACGRLATQLCDEPLGRGKTCDLPLCTQCTVRPYPGRDIDLCEVHATRQRGLFEETLNA